MWLVAAVASVAVACGTVDSRKLSGSDLHDGGGGTHSAGANGGKSNGTGGLRSGGSGGTALGGSDGISEDGGTGETGGAASAACGNGVKETGEECDDGNVQPGDGCDAQCRKEECGNGLVDVGEQCDPPKAGTCSDHCNNAQATCGDKKVQDPEECDDGNDKAGDGCFECRKECGDGKIDASIGEDCEPEYAPEHCSLDCRWLPTCGDGVVQPSLGEQCDKVSATCVGCRIVTPSDCEGEAGCGGGDGSQCTPDGGTLQNSAFDTATDGWTASGPGITLAAVNDGSPDPKSLEVSYASSAVRAEAGAYQCVPVGGAVRYTFAGRYRIPGDAPEGVGAAVTALLYPGTQCSGTFLKAFNGPLGSVRDAWTPYSFPIDLSQVSQSPPMRLLLRVDVVRPANVDGSRVRWDSIALTAPGPRCGDCSKDAGEQCDDGALNGTLGDHCSADCQVERCGDGVKDSAETCDDGNTTFNGVDACTPSCRQPNPCDTCAAGVCKGQLDACFGLTGVAVAGPRAGTARSTLCDELLSCVRTSSCDLVARVGIDGVTQSVTADGTTEPHIENCYCGTAGAHCFDDDGPANGTCRAQIEAALESTDPSTLAGRFDGKQPAYPIVETVDELIACEASSCSMDCGRAPKCGNGISGEDRHLTDAIMTVGGKLTPCDDALTTTGRGCEVEECDGGSDCDANCLRIACGNYVTQPGEDCDDGDANGTPTSGCSATCTANFHCHTDGGNGIVVEPPYEQCDRGAPGDPANDGTVCTSTQAQSTPDSCACDDKCKLVVCGNGVIQPGEQCDPPNGTTCDDSCMRIGSTPCENCIAASVDGPAQAQYCSDPLCLDVQHCVVRSNCFNPLPAFCYCGTTDVVACDAPTFTPIGPCAAEIRAGEPAAVTNDDALNLLFDFTVPAGIAMNILSDVNANVPQCAACCTPQPGEPPSDCMF